MSGFGQERSPWRPHSAGAVGISRETSWGACYFLDDFFREVDFAVDFFAEDFAVVLPLAVFFFAFVVDFFDFFDLSPKTLSQFFQNSGVVPVLTIGPLVGIGARSSQSQSIRCESESSLHRFCGPGNECQAPRVVLSG